MHIGIGVGIGYGGGGPSRVYANKLLGIQPANLIGYWPLWETSGTAANDESSQNNDGAYSNVTLGETGIGDGRTAAKFVPASNSFMNFYSAGFAADFSGAEGTYSIWTKQVTGATQTYALLLRAADTNRIGLRRDTGGGSMSLMCVMGNVNKGLTISHTSTAWTHWALVWSKSGDYVKGYRDGVQISTTQTGLGTWAGALNSASGALLGSISTTPANLWDGWLAHAAVWNTPLSFEDIVNLASLTPVDAITQASPLQVGIGSEEYWTDLSDATTAFTDFAKTIPVAANDDPIAVVLDKFSSTDNLTASTLGVRPLWKTNIQNSLSAAYWNGTDTKMEHAQFSTGDFTAFYVAKNLDLTYGSHIENGNAYLVITGSGYAGGERIVLHINSSSIDTNIVNSEGWNIIEITRSGNNYSMSINGTNTGTVTVAQAWESTMIGPEWPLGERPEWWADCYIGERIRYSTLLSSEDRARLRYWLAEKWDIANVSYVPFLAV